MQLFKTPRKTLTDNFFLKTITITHQYLLDNHSNLYKHLISPFFLFYIFLQQTFPYFFYSPIFLPIFQHTTLSNT
eukprot:UN03118